MQIKEQNDGQNTARGLKESRPEFDKNKLVNLRARYDGFNKLRFVYSRVIPKWIEEKDFILPWKWKQIAHRSWVLIYCLLKKGIIWPYWESYFSFNSVNTSICIEENENPKRYLIWFTSVSVLTSILLLCIFALCLTLAVINGI